MNNKGEEKASSSSISPLHLYHTYENFTRKSLSKDGLDYDLEKTKDIIEKFVNKINYSDSKFTDIDNISGLINIS